VFIVRVVLCIVFRLIVVLFCVMCVVCVLCLIVVRLPSGINPFAVKINNNVYGWNGSDSDPPSIDNLVVSHLVCGGEK
jgi:hypothetical protein